MKKYIPTILIAVIVSLVSILGTYFVISMNDNKDKDKDSNVVDNQNKENDKLESGVKLLSTKEEGNKIVQTFKIVMNNKEQEIKVNYKFEEFKDEYNHYYKITGEYSGHTFYSENGDEFESKSEVFTANLIEQDFNSDNFKIIKGIDNKDYLGIIKADMNRLGGGLSKDLYIYNDSWNLITKNLPSYSDCPNSKEDKDNMEYSQDIKGWTLENDNAYISYDNSSVKIENNKIYYLVPKLNDETSFKAGNFGVLEERIYTINNNKLEYTVEQSYKIIGQVGHSCY